MTQCGTKTASNLAELSPRIRHGFWLLEVPSFAIDTNLLVYAHRGDSPQPLLANRCLVQLAESSQPWAIPYPGLHEFLAIATQPRIYKPPTPLSLALEQIDCWLESPTLVLLSEQTGYWQILRDLVSHS